jgi:hypothetical protein
VSQPRYCLLCMGVWEILLENKEFLIVETGQIVFVISVNLFDQYLITVQVITVTGITTSQCDGWHSLFGRSRFQISVILTIFVVSLTPSRQMPG